MAELIELPHVGESVVEGTIGKWLKQPGDQVERYDPLVEVVTDKVTMEVPSPVSGELLRIIAQEGETVPMGAPIAEVETRNGQGTPSMTAAATASAAPTPAPPSPSVPTLAHEPSPPATVPMAYLIDAQPVGPTGGSAVEARAEADEPEPAVASAPTIIARPDDMDVSESDRQGRGPNRLSPAVRRLAREHSIDVDKIVGTGMNGRVTRNDVLRHLETAAAPSAPVPAAPAEAIIATPTAPLGTDDERMPLTPCAA